MLNYVVLFNVDTETNYSILSRTPKYILNDWVTLLINGRTRKRRTSLRSTHNILQVAIL